jgi:hypothetical protein
VSRAPRAESRERRVESGESRAESRERRVESRESRAESREWRVESGESRAQSRERRVESAESRAQSRERRAEGVVGAGLPAIRGIETPTNRRADTPSPACGGGLGWGRDAGVQSIDLLDSGFRRNDGDGKRRVESRERRVESAESRAQSRERRAEGVVGAGLPEIRGIETPTNRRADTPSPACGGGLGWGRDAPGQCHSPLDSGFRRNDGDGKRRVESGELRVESRVRRVL